ANPAAPRPPVHSPSHYPQPPVTPSAAESPFQTPCHPEPVFQSSIPPRQIASGKSDASSAPPPSQPTYAHDRHPDNHAYEPSLHPKQPPVACTATEHGTPDLQS